MANRRMLAASISVSEQVAQLHDDFTRLVFTWMIAHGDDYGVLTGSPARVKALVVPMLNCTVEQVSAALADMEAQELIWRYSDDDGKPWVQFRTWEEHQSGLHKRTKPKAAHFPECRCGSCPPPGSSRKFPEVPASRARAELNGIGKEEKRNEEKENAPARAGTETETTPAGEPLSLGSSSPLPDPDAERTADKAVFEAWCSATGRERVASLGERRSWMTQIRELRISVGLSPPDVAPLIVQYRAKFGADRSPTPGQVAGVYSQLTGTLNGHHPNGASKARKAASAEEKEAASRARFHAKTAVVREFAGGNLPSG